MMLCLDVGNSQIYGGLFEQDQLKFQFRKTSQNRASSDEMGVFLKLVLKENGFDPQKITQIAICSVVPDALYSLNGCCQKYFNIQPFVLQPGAKTGLKIKYRNPLEVGADRIADAIGAIQLFPNRDIIVVDFGTATTVCAITKNREFLGGNIMPGVRLSMEALEANTAKLPLVEILRPETAIGRSTIESIQAGIFLSNVGMVKEITARITAEAFADKKPLVIGTGGFSHLFESEGLFDSIIPELILKGMFWAYQMNQ